VPPNDIRIFRDARNRGPGTSPTANCGRESCRVLSATPSVGSATSDLCVPCAAPSTSQGTSRRPSIWRETAGQRPDSRYVGGAGPRSSSPVPISNVPMVCPQARESRMRKCRLTWSFWSGGGDLNSRPLRPELSQAGSRRTMADVYGRKHWGSGHPRTLANVSVRGMDAG